MGEKTGIEWTDHTHNFWYGCKKVSPGCKNCYAERDMTMYGRDFKTVTRAKGFDKPLSWKESALVFVNSWSDFLIKEADEWREEAFEVMAKTPHLTYQVLTKRAERLIEFDWPDNVWLGVSVENQAMADTRIPYLLRAEAPVKFVSAEPLLGAVFFNEWHEKLDWVICGGESGPCARAMHPDWARHLRNQCIARGTKFFFKQWGGTRKINGSWGGRVLDGMIWDEMPEPVRQMRLL